MKKAELLDNIYAGIGDLLVSSNFKIVRKEQGFVRSICHGKQKILFPIAGHADMHEVSLVVGIRLDNVEEIFHKFSESPASYHKLSTTTITPMSYFTGQNTHTNDYLIATPKDSALFVETISRILTSKVLPFLEACTDSKSVNSHLQNDQKIDCTNQPSGIMHQLILASLHEQDYYLNLSNNWRSYLQKPHINDQNKIDKLIHYLSERKPEVGSN